MAPWWNTDDTEGDIEMVKIPTRYGGFFIACRSTIKQKPQTGRLGALKLT